MDSAASGLGRRETEALMKRYLEAHPDVSSRSTGSGAVFFTQDEQRRRPEGTLFFAVATEGGFLVRLRRDDQERFASREQGGRNAALPAWLAPIQAEFALRTLGDSKHVQGEPHEWVWIPIEDEQTFNKRKPVLLESLAYARHLMNVLGT